MKEYRYRAFISYSHRDSAWAAWLHRTLESYRLPRRLVGTKAASGEIPVRFSPVFRDRDELSTASNLSEKVRDALKDSESLIVVCSPSSAQSKWVDAEIRTFLELGRAKRIFCFVVDGEPASREPGIACFPPALLDASGDEPLAADVRKWADGKRLARQKLIAGLLGIRLDDLRRRDLQRKRRWTAAGALAITGVIALVVAVGVARVNERHEREKTEQLASFIVDLGERLQSDTDLETLALISAEASKHFNGLDGAKLTPDSARKVALAMRQVGRISELQGRADEALEAYVESRDLLSAALGGYPENQQLLFELGNAEYYIGNFHLERSAYDRARAAFDNYHESALKLVAAAPQNPDWILEKAYSLINLVALRLGSGLEPDAETVYRAAEAIRLMEQAMRMAPGNAEVESYYATILSWGADVHRRSCEIRSALMMREKAKTLAEEAYDGDPSNNNLKRRLAFAISGLASTQLDTGDAEAAGQNIFRARGMLQELSAADPSNVQYRLEVLERNIKLAELMDATGRFEQANLLMHEIELAAEEERSVLPPTDYLFFLLKHIGNSWRQGQHGEAEQLLEQARAMVAPEGELDGHEFSSIDLLELRFQWWQVRGEDLAQRYAPLLELAESVEQNRGHCDQWAAIAKMHLMTGNRERAVASVTELLERGYAHPAFMRFCRENGLCR